MSKQDPLYTKRDDNGNEITDDQDGSDQDTLEKMRIIGRCQGSAGVDSRFLDVFGNLKPSDGGKR